LWRDGFGEFRNPWKGRALLSKTSHGGDREQLGMPFLQVESTAPSSVIGGPQQQPRKASNRRFLEAKTSRLTEKTGWSSRRADFSYFLRKNWLIFAARRHRACSRWKPGSGPPLVFAIIEEKTRKFP